jgi:exodeoxyribonuclease V alpha subunit
MEQEEKGFLEHDLIDTDTTGSVDAAVDRSKRILLPCRISEKPIFDGGEGDYLVVDAWLDASKSDELMPDDMGFPNEWLKRKFCVIIRIEIDVINPLVTYMFSGRVVENPKYGKQFDVDFYYIEGLADAFGLRKYLDKLPHVGPIRSNKIISMFGGNGLESIAEAMSNDAVALTQISGITEDRARHIAVAWNRDIAMRDTYMWLVANDFPMNKIGVVFQAFGKDLRRKLERNPYLVAEVHEVGFHIADNFAHRIGNVDSVHRTSACVAHVMNAWVREGNLCMEIDRLARECGKFLSDFQENGTFAKVFSDSIKTSFVTLKLFNRTFVYLPKIFEAERFIAKGIVDISRSESYVTADEDDVDLAQEHVSRWTGKDITLDRCQRDAILSSFVNRLTVITGGGGTGKSTICQCIKTIASKKYLTVTFLAPTGAAAKVLSNKTGCDAMTIHRALRIFPGVKGKGEDPVLKCNILVIDEFSMVGLDTMVAVIKAISDCSNMNVVFVGDPQQLPSVSPGNFLSDIIDSQAANVIKLNIVHRQSETSYIPQVADEMAKGVFDSFPDDATDISFYESQNEEMIRQRVLSIMRDYIRNNNTMDGFQVIASMKKRGAVCVNEMNDAIQAILFDDSRDKSINYNQRKFYVGDRVMQIVNDYEKDVFNGNIGTVIDCGEEISQQGRKEKFIVVRYDSPPVNGIEMHPEICKYVKRQIDDVMVCWCCTVHKFQGSQANTIVFVAPNSHTIMMKKELVYTAMTRAASMLHVVGNARLIHNASKLSLIRARSTHTKEMIMIGTGNLVIPDMVVRNLHLCSCADQD